MQSSQTQQYPKSQPTACSTPSYSVCANGPQGIGCGSTRTAHASSQRARVRGDSAPLRSHEDAEGCPVGADNMRFVLPIAVPERKREDDARTAQNNITKSRSAYRHQSLPAFPPFQGSDPRGATSELASFNRHRSYFSTRDNNGSSRISFGGDGHEKLAGPRSGQDIGQLLAHRYGGRPVGGIKRLDNTKVERLFV